VVLLRLNAWLGEGARLARTFSKGGAPAFLLLDSDAEVISKWSGYEKASFLESLGEGLSQARER